MNSPVRGRGAAPILSLVAGLVQAASFWPVQAWWLQVLALAALVALVLRLPQRAFVLGFAFGLGCFVAGVSWLYVSMHRYGGMPAALAALALLLFAAYLACFGAAVCAAFARVDTALRARAVAPTLRATALGALFAGAWALAELLRGWLFTGFPWLAIGYAQLDGPLASFAPLLGVYGVCLLAALVAFGLALAVGGDPGRGSRSARAIGAAMIALPVAAGLGLAAIDRVSPHGAPLHVRLLQGNVAQDMKFDAQRSLDAMHWYANELLREDAPLTVLPETAWTLPWSRTPLDVREEIVDRLRHTNAAVAIGMPLYENRPAANASAFDVGRSLTNSVGVVDATGAIVWRYDKRHLVPFGEFVPFGFGWFVDLMRIPLGDFARGSRDQAPLPLAGQRIAFDICYEDLFGEEIAAQVRGGATILVNVSNIAWFGDSHALPQHLQIARMRALELARPMLRATNTGVTAAIDAHGRVLAQLEPYTAGALDVQVQGADGTTPYARFGNAPVFALSLGLVAAAAVAAAVASARFGTRTTGRRDDSSR
ncbi:MAG: apolipoprotein N-acyltransferase [Burkholderiaceae bacterium]|nr:apolipoprotein N-acyltransferase [Burkholderiaceae bacterium]